MKQRYLPALVAACALLSAFAAGPALAGGGLPIPIPIGQSVSNTTDQSNEATAINVPILSGNNVAILGNGDQSNSAGTDQDQTNVNATDQQAAQGGQSGSGDPDNSTDQSNRAEAINVPIVSGNNVSVLSDGKQSNSAGVEQTQTNVNVTDQQASQSGSSSKPDGWYGEKNDGSVQKVENSTDQSNRAEAINVPIVSGNNVSVLSNGKQSNSAGVEQTQTNVNVTKQSASQSGGSYSTEKKRCKEQQESRFESSSKQSVRNRTRQVNEAKAFNLPILSGNNVSVLSNGRQWNSAGVEQTQTNVNVKKQSASQSGGSYSTETKRCKESRFESSTESVRNRTSQENEAKAFNLPILSGNNVSVLSNGRQSNSAGVEQTQTNVNYTAQQACLRL
jgi:hypothetical protein